MTTKIIVALFALLVVVEVNANKSVHVKHFKDFKRESLKCHLVMENGKDGIVKHYDLPVKDRATFKQKLLNKKFKSNGKFFSVSEVKECVSVNKKFKGLIARQLDIDLKVSQ